MGSTSLAQAPELLFREFMVYNSGQSSEDISLESEAQTQKKNRNQVVSGIFSDAGAMMCSLLGKEEYVGLILFFLKIVQFCMSYGKDSRTPYFVVYITRRCNVLKVIFFQVLESKTFQEQLKAGWFDLSEVGLATEDLSPKNIKENIQPLLRAHFITDSNLLAMDSALAKYYAQNGSLPTILIADELLLHGRAMNKLLLSMEEHLKAAFSDLELDKLDGWKKTIWKEDICSAFRAQVQIKVYAQKSGGLLLYKRYAQDGKFFSGKCMENEWRIFSLRIARIVSASAVNNIGFSWGFSLPVSYTGNIFEYNLQVPTSSGKMHMHYCPVVTHMQHITLRNHIVLFVLDNKVKAVWSLRMKKSLSCYQGERQLLIVPYLMISNPSRENVKNVFFQLKKAILEKKADFQIDDYQALENFFGAFSISDSSSCFHFDRICDIVNLILNCLLLKSYLCLDDEAVSRLVNSVEWDHLCGNYSRFDPIEGKITDIKPALRALWKCKLNCPEHYIAALLEDADGLNIEEWSFRHPAEEETLADSKMEQVVLDVIHDMGLDAEQNAYKRSISMIPSTEALLASWGSYQGFFEVLETCRDRLGTGESLYSCIAELIHAMDLGIVGMNIHTRDLKEEDDTSFVYTMVKAGEQALFIKPLRYRNFIPLLSEIEQEYRPDQVMICHEVAKFIRKNKDAIWETEYALCKTFGNTAEKGMSALTDELIHFLKRLYASGQTVSFWNIPLSEQLDKEDAVPAREQEAQDLQIQNQYIHLYHRMYGYY